MIQLICANCKTVLNIDDAFAGGVCRCQHCGTIQTVPANLKDGPSSGAVAQAASMEGGQKTLYKNKARAEIGTGLDTLADALISSGLSDGGLTSQRLRHSPPTGIAALKSPDNRLKLLFVGGGILLLVLLLIAWKFLAPGGKTEPSNSAGGSTVVAERQSVFCGIKLNVPDVIYVLDRGSGTQSIFGDLKNACYNSILSLGSNRKFQVIFWNNGSDVSYPSDNSLVIASPENVQFCKQALQEVYAFGKSDVRSALTKAVAANPAAIVLATGKGWDLDDEFVQTVLQIRGNSKVKIHTVSLGKIGGNAALQGVAQQTGGEFREITTGDLHNFAQ